MTRKTNCQEKPSFNCILLYMESWEELECNLVKLLIFLEKLHSVAGILWSNSQTGGDTNKLPQHHHHHHPRHHHHHLHHHHHHQQISLLCSYIFITGICHGTQLTNPSHKSQLSRAINYIITISGDIFQKKNVLPCVWTQVSAERRMNFAKERRSLPE